MKEVIYTIPINDAYDVKCGCPVCRLENKLEQETLEYIMGAAMMEPDVRIETNKSGFCQPHFKKMLKMNNRLSLTLMLQSYLGELLEEGFTEKKLLFTKKDFAKISDNYSLLLFWKCRHRQPDDWSRLQKHIPSHCLSCL